MTSYTLEPVSSETGFLAAALIYEAFNEYYDIFGLSEPTIKSLISEQLALEGTEISGTSVLSENGHALPAVLSALPANDLGPARMQGTFHLLGLLDNDQKAVALRELKSFAAGFHDVPDDCFYLSRIAVSSTHRRKNLGSVLLQEFTALGKDYPALGLHVSAARSGTVQFYQNNGYEIWGPDDAPFLAMVKQNRP